MTTRIFFIGYMVMKYVGYQLSIGILLAAVYQYMAPQYPLPWYQVGTLLLIWIHNLKKVLTWNTYLVELIKDQAAFWCRETLGMRLWVNPWLIGSSHYTAAMRPAGDDGLVLLTFSCMTELWVGAMIFLKLFKYLQVLTRVASLQEISIITPESQRDVLIQHCHQ